MAAIGEISAVQLSERLLAGAGLGLRVLISRCVAVSDTRSDPRGRVDRVEPRSTSHPVFAIGQQAVVYESFPAQAETFLTCHRVRRWSRLQNAL
jgi:hypothetical protein